jgi:GAF domain-containing protein
VILGDPARMAALRESGLSAVADASMDRFAAIVRVQLQVPIALVSLVESDRQVLPGMQGLPQPWAIARELPLSHSFCQHVVTTGEPLVLSDARTSSLVRDNLAIPDLGVLAYAGMPLTDVDGQVLGALSAIGTEPREWSEAELLTLSDLAVMCSTELRLRLVTHQTEVERDRSRELSGLLELAFARNQLLLNAAQALAGTNSLDEICHQVTDLVPGEPAPSYVGLVVTEEGGVLRRVVDRRRPLDAECGDFETYSVDTPTITAKAVRDRHLVYCPDPESVARDFPPETVRRYRDLDLHAVVCAPLVGVREVLGVLVTGWNGPHPLDAAERAMITTIAAYTAQALERVRYLEQRVNVAREMQEAMRTDLPDVQGLAMAARYLPAAAEEAVGGDWYDAVSVPYPGEPGDRALAVTVGDITGHDVHASTLMGQVRSMMRQAAWCHPGGAPSLVVEALESALTGIPVPAHGTLVHSQLLPHGDGTWTLRYSNAGHPPPILVHPGGSVTTLDEHDVLFGFAGVRSEPRTDHDVPLAPGTTVFLYTDGLVERRELDLDQATGELCALLGELAGRPPEYIVDTVVTRLLGRHRHDDDVVVLAIKTRS